MYAWNLEQIYSRGITGQGITTAVLDTGIFPHRAFMYPKNRIEGFYDFVNGNHSKPYDDNGHGTHVSGIIAGWDSQPGFPGSLAGPGQRAWDGFPGSSADPGQRARAVFPGVAPESRILSLKVLDKRGNGKLDVMIEAIDWLLNHWRSYNVRIVNISVGMPIQGPLDPRQRQLVKKVEQLWDQGLVVVVAAGNEGPGPYTITNPGISRKVITVGALEEQISGRRHRKKGYSGCGPVPVTCVCKPDVVAPAAGILSCSNRPGAYTKRSGTSMAAPIVSGILGLALQARPGLSNLDLKIRLMETSIDLGQPRNRQGWGLINPRGLIEMK
ncbi:MAG: S8 family peptidase [Eubacterium sp.]|nr:S8 family peptidase [Eubacterium sp.]